MDRPSSSPKRTSSSKKKKDKKDKKEKRRKSDGDAAGSSPPLVNGSKGEEDDGRARPAAAAAGKKKKKDGKKRKRESSAGDAAEENGSAPPLDRPDRQRQPPTKKPRGTSSSSSPPPPSGAAAQEAPPPPASRAAIHPPAPSAPTPPRSAFSLVAGPPAQSSSEPAPASGRERSSPYRIKTMLGTVALLPSSLADVAGRVRSLLHSLLLAYDANMGGVLLSLEEEVQLLPADVRRGRGGGGARGGLVGGRVADDLPHVHYRFRARGLLFCPAVGMKLRGQVVECTSTFVALTTHHVLSTKISTERLRERGFRYDATTLEWTRERGAGGTGDDEDASAPSTSIYLDDVVEFVVERIHECGGYISLDGARPSVSTLS
ncbi:hypothetical protein ACHAWF_017109 [Thalassiosira exigua]